MSSASAVSVASVNSLFAQVQSVVTNRTFTVELFIDVTVQVMQLTEAMPSLTGAQKKSLVVAVLNKSITELPINADLKTQLQFLMQAAIPYIIDLLIAVESGAVSIEKKCAAKCGGCSCF